MPQQAFPYTLLVKSDNFSQFLNGAMFYEFVGQSETCHRLQIPVVVQPFRHCRAEASVAYSVLYGYYSLIVLSCSSIGFRNLMS